jgi:IclR family acetate operon transcriptional repressor
VKSVRNALRVFEEVAARQPVGLSELARRLDLPKATVQRALSTLEASGWLRHDISQPGLWVVTARFSVLADASPAVIAARDAARPVLRDLRWNLDGSPGLFVLDGDRMVLLAGPEETTLRALEAEHGPLPVHLSAAGRAILAELPAETVDGIIGHAVPDDPALIDRLREAVERAARDGYAAVDGEYLDEVGTVAAAVVDADGEPVAALAVIVGAERLRRGGDRAIGASVVEAATRVSAAVAGTRTGA